MGATPVDDRVPASGEAGVDAEHPTRLSCEHRFAV